MSDLNEQLIKLLMESYDKGVADAKDAAFEAFEKGVAAAVKAEREACAKVCDDEATIEGIAQRCAAAIRARGQDA